MRVHDGRVATMGILCDVPVHELTAGDKHLLQPSRNWPMHQAGAYAHLRCGLRLESGRRYLLLGRNGVGKSTLLQAIADGSLPDWPERVTTYLVAQGSPLPPGDTPLDAVLAADARQASLLAEARRLEEEDEDDHDASDADEANEANEAKGTASVVDAKVARLCEIYDELDALGAEDEGAREGSRAVDPGQPRRLRRDRASPRLPTQRRMADARRPRRRGLRPPRAAHARRAHEPSRHDGLGVARAVDSGRIRGHRRVRVARPSVRQRVLRPRHRLRQSGAGLLRGNPGRVREGGGGEARRSRAAGGGAAEEEGKRSGTGGADEDGGGGFVAEGHRRE